MLGIKGEEEEQPARRSAGLKSVKNSIGVDSRRLTEENDRNGNEDHKHVVVAQEWQDPWIEMSATTSLKASLCKRDLRRKLMTNLMFAMVTVLRLYRRPL